MIEEWKYFNPDYLVSNLGNVKSRERSVIRSNGRCYFIKERILKPAEDSKGYLRVGLSINGKLKTFKVHRMVAKCFLFNCNNYPQVNHLNGIKNDNRAENLEWCTNQQNVQHAYDNNMIDVVKGEEHHNSKLTIDIVNQMKRLRETGLSFKNISKQFNVSRTTCSRAIQGITWK